MESTLKWWTMDGKTDDKYKFNFLILWAYNMEAYNCHMTCMVYVHDNYTAPIKYLNTYKWSDLSEPEIVCKTNN